MKTIELDEKLDLDLFGGHFHGYESACEEPNAVIEIRESHGFKHFEITREKAIEIVGGLCEVYDIVI